MKFATRICPSYSHTDHEVQRCQVLFHFLYECKVRNPNVKSRAPSPDAIAWSVRILPVGLPLVPVLHKRTALYQAQHRHALSPKTPTISNLNVRNTFRTCMEAEKLWSLVITKKQVSDFRFIRFASNEQVGMNGVPAERCLDSPWAPWLFCYRYRKLKQYRTHPKSVHALWFLAV